MKALIYQGPRLLKSVQLPTPSVRPDEVLIRVKSVGICGTDLHIYNGGTDVQPGVVIGHEFSGEVVQVGSRVRKLKKGDRVVAEHVISCKVCHYCVRGKPNLCLQAQVIGLHRNGALAEFLAIPADLVYPFPSTISYQEAALIEPLTIALYAASQTDFLLEKKVAVVGQGPIGILLDQVLGAMGAHVIGIDVVDHRLEFVRKKKWVRETYNAMSTQFPTQLQKLSALGVDVAFEVVGKEATANLCIDLTRRDGSLFLLGVFEKPATLNIMRVVQKELHIKGSWTCAFSFPIAIDMLRDKKVDVKSLITHVVPFSRAQKAFQDSLSYSDKRIKTIIEISR